METWRLVFEGLDLEEEKLRETLTSLGNGFFASRGAAEEENEDSNHYPGTYLAGGYNRLKSDIDGREIENEDLVNWPNWLCITFKHPNEDWFSLGQVRILDYKQDLNLKEGVLTRHIHFTDSKERETKLKILRFVSMDNPHVGAIEWSLIPINWSSSIEVKVWIDGSVTNRGVERYKRLNSKHLKVNHKDWIRSNVFLLHSETVQSELEISQCIRVNAYKEDSKLEVEPIKFEEDEQIGLIIPMAMKEGTPLNIEKVMTLFSSRDRACSQPDYEARRLVERLPRFSKLLERHVRQWDRIWNLCDVKLPENPRETRLLRLHIFHLLQTVSLKSIDLDVGVPARGLHGEAYRGHIFWDELFILPFLNLRIPELGRSLLLYRYRRLDEARLNARERGFQGALFPWQSGSNGEEESQEVHLNPLSRHWVVDATYLQRHINGAILYNLYHYYQATGDKGFLGQFGVEMALEICKFWVSILKFNEIKQRYEILGVVGPDEFHTSYPDSSEPGINNNAYTNMMASWCIKTAIKLFYILPQDEQTEILKTLNISYDELNMWLDMSRRIFLPLRNDGVMDQFEGFSELEFLDWNKYRAKYGNIERIDRILEAENDDVNCYQVNKQADFLMLYYLFSKEEIRSLFEWLNYPFESNFIKKNISFHLSLTTNGSTLSRIVHAWILSKYDIGNTWEWFTQALETDVSDLQGGTTTEGIHLGAMAGTIDLVQRGFLGIEVYEDLIWFNPKVPKELAGVQLHVHFRGHSLAIKVVRNKFEIKIIKSSEPQGKFGFQDKVYEFKKGDIFYFNIENYHHVGEEYEARSI